MDDVVLNFTRLFANQMAAGCSALACLRDLRHRTEFPDQIRDIIHQMAEAVECGCSLGEAVARQSTLFDGMYASVIRAGETGGDVRLVLEQLVHYGDTPYQHELARSCSMLGYMVRVGVPILECLAITRDACQNPQYRQIFQRSLDEVRAGGEIAAAFAASAVVPPNVIQLVSTGEETGDLDGYLLQAAQVCEGLGL